MSSFILKTVGIASVGLSMLAITVSASPWPKRGLAYNEDIPIWQFGGSWEGAPSQVNWQYNWDSSTSNKQSFAEYVPMLWSDASDHTSRWVGNANAALSSGSGHLLSFNEPDDSQQANMGVQQAANSFRTWMTPFHGRAQLGSPAVTNGGLSWLSEFLGECGDCEIDFVAVHWYDSASNFAYFTSFINQVCSIANGRQVWLTEFQGSGTVDQQSSFLSQAIPFLDNNPCIYRYAYFATADPDTLFLENGGPSLSPIGVQFTFSAY